jgi:restriction system protein
MTPSTSPFDLLTQLLKSSWALKEIYITVGIILLMLLCIRILKDLLSRKSKIKWFLGKKKIRDIQQLTPTQFEQYISELFRRTGYKTTTVGGVGDGGIDVVAEKDGNVHYIQCKKFITRKVHVGDVRDFYGAIADKIDRDKDQGKGYFITTNIFTRDAEKFAEDKPIELVDRFELMKYIRIAGVDVSEVLTKPESLDDTVCLKCGGRLVLRNGKFGKFLGCENYPRCAFTKKL